MKIGSTPITDIKVGSTQITKVIRNGITYWEAPWTERFSRADGAVGNDWVGSTWTIADGKVINTPNLGTELILANYGAFDGTYVAGLAPGWTKNGTLTVTEEVGITGKAQGITNADGGANIVDRSVQYISNTWYRLVGSGKLISGTGPAYIRLLLTVIGTSADVLRVTSNVFVEYIYTYRCSAVSGYSPLRLWSPAGTLCAYDNISVKPLITSELFLSRECPHIDKLRIRTGIKIYGRAEGGMFICLDSATNPQNYVYVIARDAYADNGNRSGSVSLFKCVNGVHSQLTTGTVIMADYRYLEIVRKDSTTFSVYYDNMQIGTDVTINDVSILNNTKVGVFSTDNRIKFNGFEVAHIGSQKQVPSNTLLHTVIVASDIHVGWPGVWNAGELDGLVTKFNTINPDATLLLGDLTENGIQTEKDTFDASFNNLTSPNYKIEGNHDTNSGLDLFPHHFVYNIGGFTLIAFHTIMPAETAPNGAMESEELAWLEAQIVAATGRVILFSHIPIYNLPISTIGEERTCIASGYGREELMALCVKYGIKAVFSGHNHLNGDYNVVDGVAYYSGMSCMSVWQGFQILKFYSDRINLMRYNARTPFTQYGENMGINTWF